MNGLQADVPIELPSTPKPLPRHVFELAERQHTPREPDLGREDAPLHDLQAVVSDGA